MPNSVEFKVHSAPFMAALKQRVRDSTKSAQVVMRNEARLFVQDAILITPPNKDYKANRKGGEATVKADIKKIFRGVRAGAKDAITNPETLHASLRSKSDGRVQRAPAKKFGVVNLPAFIKKELANVGILASGWNAAARALGAKVPEWISRHGNRGGSFALKVSAFETRIKIVNAIKFSGQVKGLTRRVQAALDKRAGAMERQIKSYQDRLNRKPL